MAASIATNPRPERSGSSEIPHAMPTWVRRPVPSRLRTPVVACLTPAVLGQERPIGRTWWPSLSRVCVYSIDSDAPAPTPARIRISELL
jgi:hypothetical protein